MGQSILALKKIQKQPKVSVGTQVADLHIQGALYAAIKSHKDEFDLAEINRENRLEYSNEVHIRNFHEGIHTALNESGQRRNVKYIAVGLHGKNDFKTSISELWLKEDIVPFVFGKTRENRSITEVAREVSSHFNDENLVYVQMNTTNEVKVSELVSLEDYRKTVPDEDFGNLKFLVKKFKGKKLTFLGATPQGGGVALMRHALIRLYKLLGVDAHWYVLIPKKEAFAITKSKFHNVLQAVSPVGIELTDEDKDIYNSWTDENAKKFASVFKNSDVIVVDDPQPAGLIPYIKKINPRVKIIYRSHIQIVGELASTNNTVQRKTWEFLWKSIQLSDLFISHPIKEFIPSDVPMEKILYMPATTDPLDGLNKPLSEAQMNYYMRIFNKLLLIQEGQAPLDMNRPYIVQIARFDPAKGIPDVIESYRILRERLVKEGKVIPSLVIGGNASVDDPDGVPVHNATLELLKTDKYSYLSDDVKVVRLPHLDQLLNVLLRKSHIVLQLSTKEGFEVKVTEGLMKGKPVVAYKTGGIPLQIEDGVNGFLIEPGNTQEVADKMYELFVDKGQYKKMSAAAVQYANKDYLTVANAISWLFMAVYLQAGHKVSGNYQWVKDLSQAYYYNSQNSSDKILSRLMPLGKKIGERLKKK